MKTNKSLLARSMFWDWQKPIYQRVYRISPWYSQLTTKNNTMQIKITENFAEDILVYCAES